MGRVKAEFRGEITFTNIQMMWGGGNDMPNELLHYLVSVDGNNLYRYDLKAKLLVHDLNAILVED